MGDVLSDREKQRKEEFKETKRLFNRTYPSKNGLKIPEIMVLYYARTFMTEQTDFQSFWYYKYAVDNPKTILKMLLLYDKKIPAGLPTPTGQKLRKETYEKLYCYYITYFQITQGGIVYGKS